MIDINNTNSFFKSNDPCHQLILGIKCASINLKTLHRNIVGKNWYRAHDLLGDFYEKIDEFEDKIVENLMSIGCTDIEIQDNCFLEARPYEADEALGIARGILCDLLSLSLDVRNQMPLPSPVAAAFDEFENYLQIEANYKLNKYLQEPDPCCCESHTPIRESFEEEDTHREFIIEDGVLKEGPNEPEVIIPDGVTRIGDYVFSGCSNLENVTIPNSVTSIGNSAFFGCRNLENVTIPNSVTIIGESAFWECRSLTSITIPDSVTSIGDYAFFGCRNLENVTIPNSVTDIGTKAFLGCRSLTSIKYKGKEYDDIDTVINLINNKGINESFFKCFSEFTSTEKLNESFENSSLLYHATSFENALKILKDNKLEAKGNYWFNLINNKQCICFSRSYYFVANEMPNNEVIFVFDKDKLTTRYHIEPISDSKNSYLGHVSRYQNGSKAEEVCYTDIDDVDLYIKHVIVDDSLYEVAVENMPQVTVLKKSEV